MVRNIQRLRVAKGLSQEILAVDAEIDRTYVSRLERGLENPLLPFLNVLQKLCPRFRLLVRKWSASP